MHILGSWRLAGWLDILDVEEKEPKFLKVGSGTPALLGRTLNLFDLDRPESGFWPKAGCCPILGPLNDMFRHGIVTSSPWESSQTPNSPKSD